MLIKDIKVGATVRGKWQESGYWQGVITVVGGGYLTIGSFVKYNESGEEIKTYPNYTIALDSGSIINNFTLITKSQLKTIKSWKLK